MLLKEALYATEKSASMRPSIPEISEVVDTHSHTHIQTAALLYIDAMIAYVKEQ